MTTTSTALWALLAFAGAPPEQPVPTEAEVSTTTTTEGLAELDAAVAAAAPSEESARQLAAALEQSQAQGLELVDDPDALDLHDRARLTLVAIYLATDDEALAERAMDEAIRSAMGRDIGAARFGPAVFELHERRLQALTEAGTASIAIECEDCEVIVNEARLPDPAAPLYLGTYRVWVRFAEPGRSPERLDLDLERAGTTVTRSFVRERRSATTVTAPPDKELGRGRTRLLPRWVEIASLSLGAASLVSGVLLTSLHLKCRGAPRTGDLDTCKQWYYNRPQDLVLIGLGAGLVVAAGVTLTYDELRVGPRRDRRAMVTWTFRF